MYNGRLLNLDWKFKQGFDPVTVVQPGEGAFETVNIPHTVQEIPYDCFDQYMTCMLSTYVKYFQLENISGKRVLLSFEGVSAFYELYMNGKKAGSHKGAYSMALFDVTEFVQEGENRMVLMVDSHERDDIPPNGSTVDFLIYGGIYRDVTLYVVEELYAKHMLLRYEMEGMSSRFHPELLVENHRGPVCATVKLTIRKKGNGKKIFTDMQKVDIPAGSSCVKLEARMLESVELWSVEDPVLYEVCAEIFDEMGRLLDVSVACTGFRTVAVDADGFYLNGKKIKLIGLNRHQSYPYVGYAMGKRAQEKDARLLKEFMGLNMVRCSHYMQSRYFLDCCDEIGLLVFEEIPGWGYIGGSEFKEIVFQDLDNMVLGHYNHPGIVMWGTRLNETTDDDELYEQTNYRCKDLDSSRPTTGVRWETGSHLIEDIYSYNDYTEDDRGDFMLLTAHEATECAEKVPYLVSEHTGAVLPTKPFDSEERQEAFAIRHARVLGKVQTMDSYLGALGWCMFDYNTHNDHNSLNKVCYHGVLDMFRVPKWAAYFYASQKEPAQEVVMVPCSMVGRGERCEPVPFYVLTNCDYIEVTLSKDITRAYYPSVKFNGLAHPPIEVTQNGEFWQHRWEGARIVGYVDGQAVAEKIYSNNPRLSKLEVEADDTWLYNDRVDETRMVVYFVDENGNRLYGHQDVICVETSGDIELIGPSLLPAMGGAAAFWIRTKATMCEETASVHIHSQRKELEDQTVTVELRCHTEGRR